MQRLDLWHNSFILTVVAAVVVGPLSIIPARRAGLVLIVLEGVAVAAMLFLAVAVLLLIAQGHGPQGDPPLRDLFIPTAGVGAASIAMGLSFGILSFAGFEQVATLGEEVKQSRFTIPHVLIGTVIGAGLVFTLVSAAEILGFGTDPVGVASFTKSSSLLADLSGRYSGGWSGDLFDALAICSAMGGALASIVACSRILLRCAGIAPSSGGSDSRQRHLQCRPRRAPCGDPGLRGHARRLSARGRLPAGPPLSGARAADCLSARGRQRGRRYASVGAGHR
jgi:amino acid transporter